MTISTGNWSCRSGAQERQPRLQLGFISHRKGHRLGYLEKRRRNRVWESLRLRDKQKIANGVKETKTELSKIRNNLKENIAQMPGRKSVFGEKSMHSFYFTCQELLQDAHFHLECPSQLVIFTCLCPSVLRCVLNKYIFL